jgi:hypothetical protein
MQESKTDERERARLLVELNRMGYSAQAEALDRTPIAAVRVVYEHLKATSGIVGGLNLSAVGYENELRRLRLERSMRVGAGVSMPDGDGKAPEKQASADGELDQADRLARLLFPDAEDEWPAKAKQIRELMNGGDQ